MMPVSVLIPGPLQPFSGGRNRVGLSTRLPEDCEVAILPAVSGG